MKIYDISVELPYTPVYPGDPGIELIRIDDIKNGSVYNLTQISMSLHAGTHADAPLHFIDDSASIERLSPEIFCGNARVITIYKETGGIEKSDLEPANG